MFNCNTCFFTQLFCSTVLWDNGIISCRDVGKHCSLQLMPLQFIIEALCWCTICRISNMSFFQIPTNMPGRGQTYQTWHWQLKPHSFRLWPVYLLVLENDVWTWRSLIWYNLSCSCIGLGSGKQSSVRNDVNRRYEEKYILGWVWFGLGSARKLWPVYWTFDARFLCAMVHS